MPIITTTSGREILVDRDTAKWATQLCWNISPRGYARTWVGAGKARKYVHLHRMVLRAEKGVIVDHINRNKLDNRRKNLRIVSAKINALNRSSSGASKYKGVGRHRNGWQVYVAGKYIGIYKDEAQAARSYDIAARQTYGKEAVTNKKLGLL